MKKLMIGVTLLALLGAACAKAEAPKEQPAAQVPVVGLSDGVMKAAMVEAGLTNFTGITAGNDLGDDEQKAAMVEDGVFRLTAWHKSRVNKARIQDGGGWL